MRIHPALADAVAAALDAPALHGAPSWRWRIGDDLLDLFEDRERARRIDAADARLAVLSCGAALHRALVALAGDGWQVTVSRLPDGRHPDHLAQVRLGHRIPVPVPIPGGVRRAGAHPRLSARVEAGHLQILTAAAESQGALLHILPRPEMSHQAGAGRLAVLYGVQERRVDWLRAGEALAFLWSTAARHGLSVRPLPGPGELAVAAELTRHRLPGACYPYLLLRFGAGQLAPHR